MTTPPGEKQEQIQPPTHKMQKRSQLYFHPFKTLIFLILFSQIQMKICCGVSVFDLKSVKDSNFEQMGKRGCVEKLKECSTMVNEEENLMDSESNRRVLLMQKKYISYGTLRRDLVPCNTPGASYYNCKPPGAANTYNRGCEIITRCAREISDIKS
ncbi:protein RALF-like 1 [Lycium ferocissimum]|uniref:protein RALF-like 1 n=1 Tax=Lycium ferocissimum TaxID=112874 RepID=UPI0028163FC4|nr:protein RALF-like 1 [Lycium ferocissimum]